MKKIQSIAILVAGLTLAGSLSAHIPSAAPGTTLLPHAHPTFELSTTTYRLFEDTTRDTVTVTWTARPACPNGASLEQEYDVTITRTQSAPVVYSLWTLGFQAIDSVSEVVLNGPGQWRLAESATQVLRAASATEKITPAGRVAPNPTQPTYQIVNDKNIWLAEFTGTKFSFTVKRTVRSGETRWSPTVFQCDADASGHDNTPPN